MDIEALRQKLTQFGQEHLLKFWETKDSDVIPANDADATQPARQQFYEDLMALELDKIMNYFHTCTEEMNSGRKLDAFIEPLPDDVIGRVQDLDQEQKSKYEEIGLREISEGRVAVLLLAGGQGTRLGVSYPKGLYDVGLPSRRTLYQIQAERIIKVQQLASKQMGKSDVVIPWYIMTSEHTQEETERYFVSRDHFGLDPKNIIFFEQNTLPCMSYEGKIILEAPFKISRAPDGNGGLYKALEDRHILDDMEHRGVKHVHVYCVDNILVRLADPVFIGFSVHRGVQCAAKVVEKVDPAEPVGVVCAIKGGVDNEIEGRRYGVIEYSEISKEASEMREASKLEGKLLYRAGAIANHYITTEFLRYIVREKETQLKHHVAKKKIPHCDEAGNLVKPTAPNGIKMEKFVFDIFPFAHSFAVWEVLREEEFSPLKNAEGAATDTPSSSRRSLLSLHGKWVQQCGGSIQAPNPSDSGSSVKEEEKEFCEISPLLTYSGEGLAEVVRGRTFPSLSVIDQSSLNSRVS